jgi:ribonucleoside-diphosphate reductase alpha chain
MQQMSLNVGEGQGNTEVKKCNSPSGAPNPEFYALPDERNSVTVRFRFDDEYKGYFIVDTYDDGVPGEVSLYLSKVGSFERGFASAWATAVSMLLQYGVDPRVVYQKFKHLRFEPEGLAGVPSVPIAKSIIDLIMVYLEKNYPPTGSRKTSVDSYDEVVETVGS